MDDDLRDGIEYLVLVGLAEDATADTGARVPLLYLPPDVPYPADEQRVPIVLDITPATPGDVVTLREYTVTDDVSLSDSVMGLQVDIRSSSRRRIKAMTSDWLDRLHGRRGGMLGGVRLVLARRTSGTNVGQDSSGRIQRTENYYLTIHRPSPHRT